MIINVDFTLKKLAALYSLPYEGENVKITSISTDSREIEKGTLFVALRGEKADGNAYVPMAAAKGAAALLCSPSAQRGECPALLCEDALEALIRGAKAHTAEISPLKVAVTGSVGKTTTKEMIFSVLSADRPTHKSESNYNTITGLLLTLLAMPRGTKAVVCEMGMSARGEISQMARVLEPHIGVITCIGSSHLEYLKTRENIASAKCELLDGMNGGTLIFHGDEPLLRDREESFGKSVSFGLTDARNDLTAENIVFENGCSRFDVRMREKTVCGITLPVTGKHNVTDALAAYAAGLLAGAEEDSIRRGLMGYRTVGMRQNLYEKNGLWILEDCYNAGPESMMASLENLSALSKNGRKAAVLGDMFELGDASEELHRKVGRKAAEVGLEMLITVGEGAKAIAEGAMEGGLTKVRAFETEEIEQAAEAAKTLCESGDLLLVKASRGMRLERLIALL